MTAADAKNQTPHLDSAMRQVIEMARAIRIESGLPVEFWEFAVKFAVMVINRLGVGKKSDALGRSPMTRWTGRATGVDGWHVFGSEVFPELKSHERADGKMGAVAPGGDGRWRYLGPDCGPGFASSGHRVIDTASPGGGPPRVRVRKSCKFNEDMEAVRALPYPAPSWDVDEGEEWYRKADPPGRQEGEEMVNRDKELQRLLGEQTVEQPDDPDGPSVIEDESRVSERPRRSGRLKSVKKGVPKREAKKAGVTQPSDKLKNTKGRKAKKRWPKLAPWSEDQKIQILQNNPKTKGDMCYDRYEAYKRAKTVREYFQLGGTKDDLRWDRRRNYVVRRGTFDDKEVHLAAVSEFEELDALFDIVYPEVEDASKRYARQEKAFHAERVENGTSPPEELPHSVRMLPYWEAAAAAEPNLDAALSDMRRCAQEAALWMLQAAEVEQAMGAESAPGRKVGSSIAHGADFTSEADAQVLKYRQLAEEKFIEGFREFEAAVGEKLRHKRAVDVPTPKSYDDAMRGEFREEWQAALDSELENLRKHKVYVWVPRPAGVKILDSNWAWRVKPADDGSVAKLKVRLVGRGFREIYGVHFYETFAPVGKLTTFRVLCAEVAKRDMEISFLDIRSAYLMADTAVPKYMSVPKGVKVPKKGLVWLLKKALYGMRDSAALWHKQFRADLLEWGFKPSTADPCLFVKVDGGSMLRVLLFVDDLAITNDKTPGGRELKKWFIARIKDKYEFSSSPDDNVYLGMTLETSEHGHLVLTQRAYIERMMATLGMENCRQVWTPSPGGRVSIEDCPKCEPKDNPNGKSYREKCGMMRWIEQCSRPDISATLSELCKVQINPGDVHMKMMDHLCRYVNTTKGLGIVYGAHREDRASGPLVMYVDSDWAGDPDTFYSRGGYQALMWQGPVSWSSYKMRAVASSSAQAEYMSMAMATREGIWLRYLLSDLGYGDLSCEVYGHHLDKQYRQVRMKDNDPFGVAYPVVGDNKAALQTAKNPVHHKKAKHIHLAWNLTREEVMKGTIAPVFIPTSENPADLMTKSLKKTLHRKHAGSMLVEFRGGKLFGMDGLACELGRATPTRNKLYQVAPPGLGKPSDVIDKLDRVSTVEFEDGHRARPKQPRVGRIGVPVAVAAASERQRGRKTAVLAAVEKVVVALCKELVPMVCMVIASLLQKQLSDVGHVTSQVNLMGASLSEDMKEALSDAILDSGASQTYVTNRVQLSNAVPGRGVVKVATGRRERVSEHGDLGPLRGVRKVGSFARTLVGVMDLTEQFGTVNFTSKAAFVRSAANGATVETKIADATPSRLYKFDLEALERHVDRVADARARASG
jgi:hypothetical protein